jgi:hypothetical protein
MADFVSWFCHPRGLENLPNWQEQAFTYQRRGCEQQILPGGRPPIRWAHSVALLCPVNQNLNRMILTNLNICAWHEPCLYRHSQLWYIYTHKTTHTYISQKTLVCKVSTTFMDFFWILLTKTLWNWFIIGWMCSPHIFIFPVIFPYFVNFFWRKTLKFVLMNALIV